jgi:hypothetical protein
MDTSANATSRTRPKNKNQHPGAIQVAEKRKRRTKAQIAEDNIAEEAKNQEKARKTHEQIKNIANLEGEMAKKDANADGAHPRSRNGDVYSLVTCPDAHGPETDVHMVVSDDDAMDVRPKPKPMAKVAERRVSLRPVAKNSQRKANVPDMADGDQRDLVIDKNKGSATWRSNQIRKFLICCAVVINELALFRSTHWARTG